MTKRYALVLDASGSMGGIVDDARNLANATIKNIFAKEPKAEITVIVFRTGNINVVAKNAKLGFVVTAAHYTAHGGTPLFKSVLTAIEEIDTTKRGTTFTVITITDGGETDDVGGVGR